VSQISPAARGVRTVPGDQTLIGAIGVLLVATRGQAGPGEVLLKVRGGTEAYLAWSIDPIPKGATVLVIESRGYRAVDVSEWTDPLDPFPDKAV
jgi:predicted nucleotidyltransferase